MKNECKFDRRAEDDGSGAPAEFAANATQEYDPRLGGRFGWGREQVV